MTATKQTLQITLTFRTVQKNEESKTYAVYELNQDDSSTKVSKDYEHSTSAFAALGRLFQKEIAPMLKIED